MGSVACFPALVLEVFFTACSDQLGEYIRCNNNINNEGA